MKLELKHLSGYLPYDLLITKMDWDNYMRLTLCSNYLSDSKNRYDIGIIDALSFQARPILHRLPDLAKEIEVNGEKFIPIDELCKIHQLEYVDGLFNDYVSNSFSTEWLPYQIVQKLLEWHFDIHGLIEKGLAIDINTLNK